MRRKITASVIAALVIAGGVVALIAVDHRSTAPVAAPGPSATAASRCGLTGTPGQPTALPATWENVAGYSLPISPTDGPGARSPTASWSCYSHTPSGAVLAGWVIPLRAEGVAEDWQTVVREQTMPGVGQTVKLQSTPTQVADPVNLRGFSIAAYSDDRATIAYYLHTTTLEASCTTNLVWYEEDWRVQLESDGSTASGCTPGVPQSFVPWGP